MSPEKWSPSLEHPLLSARVYEYASKGACLAPVARREDRLPEVAAIAEIIGSPRAIFISGDVSKVEDCKRFVDATVNHFGRRHKLLGLGILHLFCISSTGKEQRIVAIASCAKWLPAPKLGFYNASKAAVISIYDTLRIEFGTKIGITSVTPGLIDSEMTQGKFLSREGKLKVDGETSEVQISLLPLVSAENCAKAIVDSAFRGEKYMTVPS